MEKKEERINCYRFIKEIDEMKERAEENCCQLISVYSDDDEEIVHVSVTDGCDTEHIDTLAAVIRQTVLFEGGDSAHRLGRSIICAVKLVLLMGDAASDILWSVIDECRDNGKEDCE